MIKNIAPVFLALLLTYSSPCLANNAAYGTAAGADVTTGTDNTIIGTEAGVAVTTGTDNTLLGYESGYGVTGSHNIVLGEDPSGAITSGSSNILVGNSLTKVTNTSSSQLDIGDTIYGTLGGSGTITFANNLSATNLAGAGGSITSLNGSNVSSGTVSVGVGGLGLDNPTAHYVLVGEGSSAVNPVSPSTSGYVLTSNGTSSDPSFQTPQSGALVELTKTSASAAASVTFSSTYITSTYENYLIIISGYYTSDGGGVIMTVSTNNGSSYLSNNYQSEGISYYSSQIGNPSLTPYSGSSLLFSTDAGGGADVGNSAATSGNATLWFQPSNGTYVTTLQSTSASGKPPNGVGYFYTFHGFGVQTGTTAVNNIKFTDVEGGNITGTFHLYGVVN
jgi:hypothetical protein